MSVFSEAELHYLLDEPRLARVATVGVDGTPHVAPVGFAYNHQLDSIDIGGHSFEQTKKYRDVQRTGRAAVVIEDVLPPWRPRGGEVRGRAEAVEPATRLVRIHPERVVPRGFRSEAMGERSSRRVDRGT